MCASVSKRVRETRACFRKYFWNRVSQTMSPPSMRACESASFNLGVSTNASPAPPPPRLPYTPVRVRSTVCGQVASVPTSFALRHPVGRSVGHPERRTRGCYSLDVWFFRGHCHGQRKRGEGEVGGRDCPAYRIRWGGGRKQMSTGTQPGRK